MTVGFNFNNGKELTRRHDARSQGTQYGNVLRTLRRSFARVANEGQLNARRTRRTNWRQATYRIAMGNGESLAVDRATAWNCRGVAGCQGWRPIAGEVILKKIANRDKKAIALISDCDILDTVKSDGVRLNFSTARGGAAFSTEFATPSRAFCFALSEVESNPGRSKSRRPGNVDPNR